MDDGSRRKNESIYLQGDETVRKVVIIFMMTISLVFLMGCTKAKPVASTHKASSVAESHIVETTKEVYEQAKITIEEENKIEFSIYYITAKCLNIRNNPDKDSDIVGKLLFGQTVNAHPKGEWAELEDGTYVSAEYLSNEEIPYTSYEAPYSSGMKSYMPFSVGDRSIFSKSSNQYKLQELCYTGNYGIRQYKERYCVAIGSHFNTSIGQYFDLILENGVVIPCVMADQKADCHTDSNNIITISNGCMTEFVVDTNELYNDAKIMGDISYCTDEWKSRVVEIRVYDKNALCDD